MEKPNQRKHFSIKKARKKNQVASSSNQESTHRKSLNDLLVETYVNVRNSDSKRVDSFPKNYNLLKELLKSHSLNYLIINRYCYKQTYSLTIHSSSKPFKQSVDLPYDEGELLTYINNEEFPPLLLSILSDLNVNVFYNGCVITEIRLYQGPPNTDNYNSTFVLLKPNTLSFVSDIRSITSKGEWTWEEKQRLESILLLATAEPLCLDPDPTVAIIENHVQHQKKRFSQYPLQRLALKHSRVNKRKRKKSTKYASPSFLNCLDYFSYNLKADFQRNFPKKDRRTFKLLPIYDDFSPSIGPSLKLRVDISIPEPKFSFTCDPVVVEEYIYEFERGYKELYYSMLTICLRPHDEQYFGLLYVWLDRDGEGQHSWFRIGERKMLDMYINQLTEILCEEGSRYIHCTRSTPTSSPRTIFSVGEKYSSDYPENGEFFRNPSPSEIALALHTEILAIFNRQDCTCCDREVKVALKRAALVLKNSGFSTAILKKRILELERREITGVPPYTLGTTVGNVASFPFVAVDSDFNLSDLEDAPKPVLSNSGIVCLPQHLTTKTGDKQREDNLYCSLNKKERHFICIKCTNSETVYLMKWCSSRNSFICPNKDCSMLIAESDEHTALSDTKSKNLVEADDFQLPNVAEINDDINKMTLTRYITFKNNDNLCWLNSPLHLFSNNKSLKLLGSEGSLLSSVINSYHDVIQWFNDGIETESKKEEASKKLVSLQDQMLEYLKSKMTLKLGECNSSLRAVKHIITSNESVQKLFGVKFSWQFKCMECKESKSQADYKFYITLSAIHSFNPINPVSLIVCPKCKTPHQERKIVYLETSNNLLFSFKFGIRSGPLIFDFEVNGKNFVMTGLVLKKKDHNGPSHLITHIRNPENNYWLNCDDRNRNPQRFSKQPEFKFREISYIMYEARSLNSHNTGHASENKHEDLSEKNEMDWSQSSDADMVDQSCGKMPKKDEIKKVTQTNYLLFRNRDNLCWLNSSLHLLLHNKTLQLFDRDHSLLSKIINSYNDILKFFNEGSEDGNEKEEASEKLISLQEEMIDYLKPIMKLKEGKCESAFFATMNIIRHDDLIQKLFEVKYFWQFHCEVCKSSRKELSSLGKNIITLNKVPVFDPINPVTLISCPNPNCKTLDQERKLTYKSTSKNLIYHFEHGICSGSLVLDFELDDKKFVLTGLIILTRVYITSNEHVNHFITYIREPETNCWLNCDDRYKYQTFSKQPQFDLEEIFMIMYEGSLLNCKNTENSFGERQKYSTDSVVDLTEPPFHIPVIDLQNDDEDVMIID